jgi:hypothetical protein
MSVHVLTEKSRAGVLQVVERTPHDGTFEVEVRKRTDPRTREQNRYFHLLCRRISGETHTPLERVKTYLVLKFVGPLEWITVADRFTGEEQQVPVLPSTSSLGKGEMSELIEHSEAWAVEQGIDI